MRRRGAVAPTQTWLSGFEPAPAAPTSGVRVAEVSPEPVRSCWSQTARARGDVRPTAPPGQIYKGALFAQDELIGDTELIRERLRRWAIARGDTELAAMMGGNARRTPKAAREKRRSHSCSKCHTNPARREGKRWRWCAGCTDARKTELATREDGVLT